MGKKFLNLFILFSSIPVYSQNIQLVPFITSGLNLPVGCYFAPGDDHLYIVQQRGKIMLATSTGTVLSTPFLDITSLVSQTGNERGLLGLAFHPDYVNNGYFYVNYTKASNGNTVIARYQRSSGNPLQADPNSQLILMEITQPYSNHNGGQLHFGPDGFLYIGMGDGGSAGDPQNNAQNMNSYLGKMLRIDVNGGTPYAVPPTNPFINNANAKPEIWALGLRNPWCFSFDKVTGDLWIADVGQNAWEEIDFQPASSTGGENYGWRCYEGAGHSYNTAGCGPPSSYTNPVAEYSHSGGHCSVTGGYVYRGALYGVLYGKYIYTDYCSGAFWATYPSGNGGFTSQSLTQLNSPVTYSLSAFGQDHNGELYVVGRDNHRIYKLTATGCQPSADIFTDQGYQFNLCPGGSLVLKAPYAASHTYQWFYNGTPVSSSGHTLAVTQEGTYSVIVTNTAGCSDTATATVVQVNVQPPVLSLPNSPLCSNDPPSPLVASPTGGEWSGPGVNNDTFHPALAGLGNHTITYTVVQNGCPSTAQADITVVAAPEAQFLNLPPELCIGETITLQASPAGGTFSGPGVSGNILNTSSLPEGIITLSYLYTDNNNCSDTALAQVFVKNCVGEPASDGSTQGVVFQNPVRNSQLWLQGSLVSHISRIRFTDFQGRSVPLRVVRVGDSLQIDLSAANEGVYVLELLTKQGTAYCQKIVILEHP